MSDAEGSGSDSDPVSDVNPEEMARLMADLDEMDNDLFKSTLKSGGKSSGGNPDSIRKESKDLSKRVTFREDSSLHSKATKVPQDDDDDDDDDDWDAGDLLLSDDGAVPHEQKNTLSKEDASNISSEKEANSEIKLPVRKDKTESSPLSSTFSPKGGDRDGEGKISAPASVKKSKARLMEDLFGNQDSPEPTTSPGTKEAGKAAGRAGGKIGKVKEEVTFEEDNDLLGDPDLDSKMATNSPKGENYLSAILKSPSAELTKREKRPDFVLDDKYKNLDKVDNSSKPAFGSYMPSTSKPGSPRQSGKQSGSISNRGYDFSPDPGKRISHATPQRKAFELDDDEILGNIRSRRAIKKEVSPEASHRKTRSNRSTPTKSENKGDWLFESTETPTANVKKAVDEESRLTGAAEKDGGYAGEDSDWLSDILAMKKKSVDSRNSNVDVLSSSSRNVKQAATAPDNSELEVGQSETGCAAVVLNTHTKQQQLLFEVSQPQESKELYPFFE